MVNFQLFKNRIDEKSQMITNESVNVEEAGIKTHELLKDKS